MTSRKGELEGRVVAVVGGDERDLEIARLAARAGARVRTFGLPALSGPTEIGVEAADRLDEALEGAHYLLLPVPGLALDGALYAPFHGERIRLGAADLARLAPPRAVVLGSADEALRRAAAEAGATLLEYEADVELRLLRGPAIVEGALEIAIRLSDVTLHRSEATVVGHGVVGSLLARTLVGLGAVVHVVARNPVQRAAALAAGAEAHDLDRLGEVLGRSRFLFSTVPVPLVSAAHLAAMAPGSVVLDLAAPPGGVDLEAAERLGLRAFWARGLGRRAPVTVGASQWEGIRRRLAALEGRTDAR